MTRITKSYVLAAMLRALGRSIRFDRRNPGFGPRDIAHFETDLCLKILAVEAERPAAADEA